MQGKEKKDKVFFSSDQITPGLPPERLFFECMRIVVSFKKTRKGRYLNLELNGQVHSNSQFA